MPTSVLAGLIENPEEWFNAVLDDQALLPVLAAVMQDRKLVRRLFALPAARLRMLAVFGYCLLHDPAQPWLGSLMRLMLKNPGVYALPYLQSWCTPFALRERLQQLEARPGYNLLIRYLEAAAGLSQPEAMALLACIAREGGRWDKIRAQAALQRASEERRARAAEKAAATGEENNRFVPLASVSEIRDRDA